MPTNELLVQTRRLDLVAATLEHLDAELASPSNLGDLLGVNLSPEWPPGEYDRNALEFFHAQLKAGGPDHVGWYTWYAITRNSVGKRESLIAGAGYMGPPAGGSAEIGYSVIPSARQKGYATEIVSALVDRAFAIPSIGQVIAHTFDANAASIQVLLRCGFVRVGPGSEPLSVQYRTKRSPAPERQAMQR